MDYAKAIKSQALSDLLAYFPSGSFEPPTDHIPGDELQANMCKEAEEWVLDFDGSSLTKTGGAGITHSSKKGKLVFS